MASAANFLTDTQKQLMSIPGAFTSLLTHLPQLVGLTGTVWLMRKGTDMLDSAYGADQTSGYSGLPISEQVFRAGEEALSFVIKLKYCAITVLDQIQ